MRLNTSSSYKNGFTLVEILVVMVIIGILATVGLGSFASSQSKGRDSQRKSELKQISNALESYYNDKGRYPASSVTGEIVGCGTPTTPTACSWGGEWSQTVGVSTNLNYMVVLPTDPSDLDYFYSANGAGTYYQLYARLENTRDGDVPKNDTTNDPQIYTGGSDTPNCGTNGGCNYGISSPNITPAEGRTLQDE